MKTQPIKKMPTVAAKPHVTHSPAKAEPDFLFGKENYKWMIIGAVILALGFFLMTGGKSKNPNVFNDNEVYSPVRITVAPILIIAGFVVEIFAIMKKRK
jgi:Protein of unknown function (DUF3098)